LVRAAEELRVHRGHGVRRALLSKTRPTSLRNPLFAFLMGIRVEKNAAAALAPGGGGLLSARLLSLKLMASIGR
jgi:hypothetical protein